MQNNSSKKSFVNVYQCDHNNLRVLYIEAGVSKVDTVRFKPFLGVHSMKQEPTSWSDIYGKPVKVIPFQSIMEMRNWKKENGQGLEILGDVKPEIQYLATQYRGDITIQRQGLTIFNFDIEIFVDPEGPDTGFPHPNLAKHPINAITIHDIVEDRYYTFSDHEYRKSLENVTYFRCNDEKELLTKFVEIWSEKKPHIITGWNIDMFDIPYLVNRINRICGPEAVKLLSREGVVKQHEKPNSMGQKQITYTLLGHIIWDYMDLYKKYCSEPRVSYSLDYISKYELGEGKTDYSEYEDLNDLYLNNFNKFIDYNIQDTTLVTDLDKKLGFIDLAISIMYKAKCTPDTIFGTVQPWDCLIYNELLGKKILCPEHKNFQKEDFPGGFVRIPDVGIHKWVAVFDIVSSYPNQIRSFNMSPETIVAEKDVPDDLRRLASKFQFYYSPDGNRDNDRCPTDEIENIKFAEALLKKYNVSWSANGQFFRNDKEGIIAGIYSRVFKERKQLKKKAGELKKIGSPEARSYDLAQHAYKILLNSGYGAMSNKYFRYFDLRIAAAITTNGQTCARGVAKYIEKEIPLVKFIYADTDSGFYCLDKVIEKRYGKNIPDNATVLDFVLKFSEQIIQPKMNEFFRQLATAMNMRELTIDMEAECIANASIHTAKKRYIMNKVWDEGTFLVNHPKLKIRGVEIIRTSTAKWVQVKLQEAVNLIFDTLSNDVLIEFIEQTRKEFSKQDIMTIGSPRGVTFSDYTLESKGLPIGVKAALKYNKFLRDNNLTSKYRLIGDGDKIKFAYVKEPNILRTHVIGVNGNTVPEELMKAVKIDYDTQFQKTFVEPLKSILTAMNWQTEKVSDLSDFFA